jgi:hypothetical protein
MNRCLEFYFASNACCCFFNIRSAMVSKQLELVKRLAQDRYERFASSLSRTVSPPSRHEVGSSNRCRTALPLSRIQKVRSSSRYCTTPPPSSDSDNSIEMWMAALPPPLRLQAVTPPPPTCLAPPPPLTRIWECPHVKEVSSYEYCF